LPTHINTILVLKNDNCSLTDLKIIIKIKQLQNKIAYKMYFKQQYFKGGWGQHILNSLLKTHTQRNEMQAHTTLVFGA
jgi:hypothetical protein